MEQKLGYVSGYAVGLDAGWDAAPRLAGMNNRLTALPCTHETPTSCAVVSDAASIRPAMGIDDKTV
jgi:hypothetical protein